MSAGGYRTTPLSGQPDLVDGISPELDAILQAGIEDTYTDFLTIVGEARGKTTDEVDQIAQGRVWDGGTARQLGLVDQFGGLEDAMQWVASQAELEEDDWSAMFLGTSTGNYDSLIRQLVNNAVAPAPMARGGDLFAMNSRQHEVLVGQLMSDAKMLSGTQGVQAYCLECPANLQPMSTKESGSLIHMIGAWLTD